MSKPKMLTNVKIEHHFPSIKGPSEKQILER